MEAEATLSTVRQKIRRELDRLEERVAAYARENPAVSYKKIGERYGVSAGYVHNAAKKHGINRAVGRKKGWSPSAGRKALGGDTGESCLRPSVDVDSQKHQQVQ